MRTVRHAIFLSISGALLGLGANAVTPRPASLGSPVAATAESPGAMCQVPGQAAVIPRISVEEATPLCLACSAAFVDARSPEEYAVGHVSGAVHLSPGKSPDSVLWQLGGERMVIVYDRDPSCAQADEVAKALLARGVRDVRVLTGAWPAWMAAGSPGASGPCPVCIGKGDLRHADRRAHP